MIIIIDNYDSNTYNIYQSIGVLDPSVRVVKNDELTLLELQELPISHLIISPGPGRPEETGISMEAIAYYMGKIPILGICLGHQLIGQMQGAEIINTTPPIHGKQTPIHIAAGNKIFTKLPPILPVGRYHSLEIARHNIPDCLLVIAQASDGAVMGIKHRKYDLYGLQFHPESILTENGQQIFKNFLLMGGNLDD